MMDEDRLKDHYDHIFTHNSPHSPYYDGADEDEVCHHGIPFSEDCEECEQEDQNDEEEETDEHE